MTTLRRRAPIDYARLLASVALGVGMTVGLAGCSTMATKKRDAIYDPVENVTEVVAILRRHIPDDTYRFEPARDFTGRNVYRASLLRLENVERIHAEELQSGYMDAVIAFAKARSLERLRAYDLAAQQYRVAARKDGELRDEALRSAGVCEALHGAVRIGIDLRDPTLPGGGWSLDENEVTGQLDQRIAELLAISEGLPTQHSPDSHYRFVVRQEVERADLTRGRYFLHQRHALDGGSVRAVSELQRVLNRHGGSARYLHHVLELANLYDAMAREYVAAVPPESLNFDPPRFQELVDAAVELYRSVAVRDGTVEKLEAGRQLEAFLAFALRVDRDRFSQ